MSSMMPAHSAQYSCRLCTTCASTVSPSGVRLPGTDSAAGCRPPAEAAAAAAAPPAAAVAEPAPPPVGPAAAPAAEPLELRAPGTGDCALLLATLLLKLTGWLLAGLPPVLRASSKLRLLTAAAAAATAAAAPAGVLAIGLPGLRRLGPGGRSLDFSLSYSSRRSSRSRSSTIFSTCWMAATRAELSEKEPAASGICSST
jgi:hypothetical protein